MQSTTTPRPEGSIYMGDYADTPIPKPRMAFIGAGRRAGYLARVLAHIEGAEIVALCDLSAETASALADSLEDLGRPRPALYCEDKDSYKRMLVEEKPDAVFVTVGWQFHEALACEVMEHGCHAFVEVPLAISIDKIWNVVDTAERCQRHCMMMENACYDRQELLFLNMVRQGAIGDILHGEGAYIHDLRFTLTDDNRSEAEWRAQHYVERNGNLYPTHGVGSVAQYMSLGRGTDSFSHLVSLSSRSIGFSNYVQEQFPDDHDLNNQDFACGDINTSIIKTKLGNTIMLQWDECTPRPYTRHNFIQGTKGVLAGFPTRVYSEEFVGDVAHDWLRGDELAAVVEKYEHPLWKRLGEKAVEIGGTRARDYLMLNRIVEALQLGAPMDQNVYEGAFWSSISKLSEQSVAADGAPAYFPDFTRGDWKTTKPLGIVY